MVVYTSDDFADQVKEIRERVSPGSKTTIVSMDFELTFKRFMDVVENVQRRPEYINFVANPNLPEYSNPAYVAVNFAKSSFVSDAIEKRNVTTDLVAWIDFGYVRSDDTIPASKEWDFDFDPNKMHYFNLKPVMDNRSIFDVVRTNDVTIMGCHIVGGIRAWRNHVLECDKSMTTLVECGLVDDDQTILLMNYLRNKNFYELHPIDETKKGWFVIFTDFNKKG
jgi:protein YibB